MRFKLLTLALSVASCVCGQPRQQTVLKEGWRFSHDLENWTSVSVPHDWAIAGPFDKKWDLQRVAIEQNGETEATEKSGRSGALPWIGKGYYRRIIQIPANCAHAELLFDGAMAEPTVYLNGQKAGYWAYGYNTFRVDITPFMQAGDNLLEVHLQNVEESSRWYPGAGLYRPVTLITTGPDWIDPWQTYIRTLSITPTEATIDITSGTPDVRIDIYDPDGQNIAHGSLGAFTIKNPKLWTPETPYLYKARFCHVEDTITQTFGIRTVKVSKEGGFQLNGVSRKIKGVCLHHDLGPLGAAINKTALIRQIKTMKAMGCDAIRTSHNMPSQLQMDLCDSLGMMVMAESFDMWVYPKCKNGYARFFNEWARATSPTSCSPTATTPPSSCGASATRYPNKAVQRALRWPRCYRTSATYSTPRAPSPKAWTALRTPSPTASPK